jgi:hypothetical protein
LIDQFARALKKQNIKEWKIQLGLIFHFHLLEGGKLEEFLVTKFSLMLYSFVGDDKNVIRKHFSSTFPVMKLAFEFQK